MLQKMTGLTQFRSLKIGSFPQKNYFKLDNLSWCVIVRRKESGHFIELHLLQVRVKTYTYIAFKASFIQRSQYTFYYVPSIWDYLAFELSHFISAT